MKLYNSFTNKKEDFKTIEENKVKIYVCGQTVYDYCHLGHARKEIVFDMIRRWFMFSGYQVTFVENITDIDDKIINRAIENNESIEELTNRYIKLMHEDFEQLGIMKPDYEPRATQYIPEMINIIENLKNKGYAYLADNGDVYFSVKKFKNYGKLSGKKIEELNLGERVIIDKYKKDPMDFVLWKKAKDNEPFWNSSFGKGRPGWHIECSAMSESILGKTFDIHGGGQDLQFPHHENEIAQSEAHNDCKFANYWLHNGFLNLNDEKMSKSLGNFYTLRDILKEFNGDIIRLLMLKTHYRSPLNFSYDLLNEAKISIDKMYLAIDKLEIVDIPNFKKEYLNNKYYIEFKKAMDEDFNTPLAISVLFKLISDININKNIESAKLLILLGNSLGLLSKTPKEYFTITNVISEEEINDLIKQRNDAKLNKDFKLADKIRNELLEIGVKLEDTISGTKWRNI